VSRLRAILGFVSGVSKLMAPEWNVTEYPDCRVYDGAYMIFAIHGYVLYQINGQIIERAGCPCDVYIFDPPETIRQLPVGPCFQLLRPGSRWFKLHWEKPAYTFSESLAYVEGILNQIPHRVLHQIQEFP
jgi:hypothetical protein